MRIPPTATATALLVAAFLGGLLSGVLLERTLFATAPEAHAAMPTPQERERWPHDRPHLALQLDLTPEQEEQVDRILAEQQKQIRAILSETRPQTRAVLHETRQQIEEVLTAEQSERLKGLYRDARREGRSRTDR